MANLVEVKLKKSWKHGIPSLGKTIVYGGRKYQVNLDDPDVNRDYEFYKEKGAFEESTKKQTKKPPQEPPAPSEPSEPLVPEAPKEPVEESPSEEPKNETVTPKPEPAPKQGKQGKK